MAVADAPLVLQKPYVMAFRLGNGYPMPLRKRLHKSHKSTSNLGFRRGLLWIIVWLFGDSWLCGYL